MRCEIELKSSTLSEPSVTHWAASAAGRLCGSGRSGGPLQPMRSSCGRSPHPLVQTVAYQPSWPILTHPPLLLLFPLFLLLLHLFLLLLAGMAHTEWRLQQALHIQKYIQTIVIPLCCTNKMIIVKTTVPIPSSTGPLGNRGSFLCKQVWKYRYYYNMGHDK